MFRLLNRAAVVAGAIAIGGCGGDGRGSGGQLLTPDDTGWVDVSTTGSTGIHGAWYAFADSADCLAAGHPASACSTFVSPNVAAATFPPTGDLGMCAVGVVGKVVAGSDGLDWGNIWGARIAFDFNDTQEYDAPTHGVTGLAFHIDAEPAPGARMAVLLTTTATGNDPPSWGGGTTDTSPVHAGRNEIRWADVGGPSYVDDPPPFDPAQLRSIQFGLKTDELSAKSFSFCINNLTALTD